VAANYRAACRARSKSEFAAKLGLVLEEADESMFWLECSQARELGRAQARQYVLAEANELTSIFAAASITSVVRRTIDADPTKSSSSLNLPSIWHLPSAISNTLSQ
jgi:hypothetical protein